METARELQFGPGMRAQRLVEAAFLIAAILVQDARLALVTFVLTLLQVLSPRWALVAQVVARFARFRGRHRIGDMYFDLGGSRGACAISVVVQGAALALVAAGWPLAGFLLLTIPAASMFDTLAPEMKLHNRIVLSNLWLFAPLVERELEKSRSSNAMTRTTAALTVVHAGNNVNLVPAHAEAFVNYRMLPGDTREDVLRHTKDVVADARVKVV